MATAKVYDTEDTLMIPVAREDADALSRWLYTAAALTENGYSTDADDAAEAMRRLADSIDDVASA